MKQITVILIALIFAAALLAQPATGQPSPATLTPSFTKTPPPAEPRQWLPVVAMRAAFIEDPPGYYTPTPAPPDTLP